MSKRVGGEEGYCVNSMVLDLALFASAGSHDVRRVELTRMKRIL